jgi:hypothetical protein
MKKSLVMASVCALLLISAKSAIAKKPILVLMATDRQFLGYVLERQTTVCLYSATTIM